MSETHSSASGTASSTAGAKKCESCTKRLYFSERVAWPQVFCFPCAQARGLNRLADHYMARELAQKAGALPLWWRWTVYLGHATHWHNWFAWT